MGKISHDDKLRKGPMATKLTRPQPKSLDCHVWGAMLQAFYKLQSKPKTISELKVHCSRSGMTCHRQRTLELFVTLYRLTTIGRRLFPVVFPVATSIVWSTLPVHVQSPPSISTFRQQLTTFLFRKSFHNIII